MASKLDEAVKQIHGHEYVEAGLETSTQHAQ